ncbi:MAG: hypothetical protein WC595_07045 [Candidatus Nanoarchaeia archaeon]
MGEKTKISDFELVEDLQDFIKSNPDVIFDDLGVKETINEFKEGTLVKVDKEIGSSIKIVSVEEVTEELIAKIGE